MHEVSLVNSLLTQALRVAEPLPANEILEIHLSCGPLSGVEPMLVSIAFDQLRLSFGLENCRLDIKHQPLLALCGACQKSFEVVDFTFSCTACGSSQVVVTQGDDFRLMSLVVTS